MYWDRDKTEILCFYIDATVSLIMLAIVLYRKNNQNCTLYEKIIRNLCIADVGLEINFLIQDIKYLIKHQIFSLWIDMTFLSILNFFISYSLIWVIIISYTVYQNLMNPNFQIVNYYKKFIIGNIIISILASAYALYFEINYYLNNSKNDFRILVYSDVIVLLICFTALTYYYVYSLLHLKKIGFDLQQFFKQLLIYPTILIVCWFPIPILESLVLYEIIKKNSDTYFYLYGIFESLLQLIGLFDALAYGWRKNSQKQTQGSSYAINIEINEGSID